MRSNGTTLAITTQICLNSGVCDPPVTQEVTLSNEDRTYSTRSRHQVITRTSTGAESNLFGRFNRILPEW